MVTGRMWSQVRELVSVGWTRGIAICAFKIKDTTVDGWK